MIEEESVLFKCESGDVLNNEKMLNNFWEMINQEHPTNTYPEELFIKVGDIFNPITFNFDLNIERINSSGIFRVDEPTFIANALRTIQKYRIIQNSGPELGVYKLSEGKAISNDRKFKQIEHILVFNGNQVLRIITKPNQYIYTPITFESLDKTNFFTHEPNLDIRPEQVRLTLSFATGGKSRFFMNMYNKTLEHYLKYGSKIEEPKK